MALQHTVTVLFKKTSRSRSAIQSSLPMKWQFTGNLRVVVELNNLYGGGGGGEVTLATEVMVM